VDVHYVRQGTAGYSNVDVLPGDRLVAINGLTCGHVGIQRIQQLLRGARDSAVELTLVRKRGDELYSVRLRRHRRFEFQDYDAPSVESRELQAAVNRHSAPTPINMCAPQSRLDSAPAHTPDPASAPSPTLASALVQPDCRRLASSANPGPRRLQQQLREDEGEDDSSRCSSGPTSQLPSARPFDMPPALERWLGLSCARAQILAPAHTVSHALW
jgi:hypothetical protein